MVIARQPFCWKWISVTKVSKYGKSEYSRALNASYTFQPLMSFWPHCNTTPHGDCLHDQSPNCQPYCSLSWTSHHRPSKTHSSARCRLPGENVTRLHSVWLPVKGFILQLINKIALKIWSFAWTCFFGLKDKNNVFHLVFHLLLGRSKYK